MYKTRESDSYLNTLPDGEHKRRLEVKKLAAEMIVDETLYAICNEYYVSFVNIVKVSLRLGLVTPKKANVLLAEAEDFLLGLPEVSRRLQQQVDEDGWLAEWLSRHPEYLTEEGLQ